MPKVSVIIPCYNQGQYIEEAVESVLDQTYQDFEIVIVNDGSTDEFTNNLLNNYNKPKTRVIYTKNQGLASARNNGIEEAKGEYILPLDADDKVGKEYLENAVKILDENPGIGIVYCKAETFGAVIGKLEIPEYSLEDMLIDNIIFSSGFYRKEDWEKVGGYDPKMLYGWEDYDFWLSLIETGVLVHRIPKTLFYYRIAEDSMVRTKTKDQKVEMFTRIFNKHERLLKDNIKIWIDKILDIRTNEIRIEENKHLIQQQFQQIQAKDMHIQNIESELNLIKGSKVWRTREFFRRLFYIKLLGTFPLLQRALLTISREGFRHFLVKTGDYIKRNKKLISLGVFESDYDKWIKKNQLTDKMIAEIKEEIIQFGYNPTISIIMPVYNVDQVWLEKAIDSVINQLYKNWELCIADDASTKKHTKKTLERYSKKEKRIKVRYLEENQGISGASNEALSMATGEYIGLLDNDDELTIDALYENVKLLNKHPKADIIYSDDDKLDMNGNRCEPHFKPDWSPDMFLSEMYTCHFGVYRKSIVDKIGGFRKGYEGSQDYDLVLRLTEKTINIFHIPAILYHWRKIPGSAAHSTNAKDYAYLNAKKALSDYLRRNSIEGEVVDGKFVGSYRVRRRIKNDPKISIIIPFKDEVEVLERCLSSIAGKTNYKNYKIYLVNNQSEKKETFKYLDKIKDNPIFSLLDYNKPFNFSAVNNYAVDQIDSEYIVFLNNDTEVISPDWIEAMLEFCQRKDVGAVGAVLYYPNETVQHGGIILGIAGVAAYSHRKASKDSFGYFGRLKIIQNLSAVTAACLMTKKTIFKEIGGFDENCAYAFNDVDLCLRMREKGYLIIYTPYAEFYHHESLSRGYEDTPEKQVRFSKEIEYFQRKWKEVLAKGDPYYNPNLTLEREDFSIRI